MGTKPRSRGQDLPPLAGVFKLYPVELETSIVPDQVPQDRVLRNLLLDIEISQVMYKWAVLHLVAHKTLRYLPFFPAEELD